MKKVLLTISDEDRADLREAASLTNTPMSRLVRLCLARALASVVNTLGGDKPKLRKQVDWSDLFDRSQPRVKAYMADEIRQASRR